MSRPLDYGKKFTELLLQLKKKYPTFSHPRNISTAFSDYGDFWGMSDREACFALEKYITELELDAANVASADYVDKILEDGAHLFDNKEDEEEEEDNGDF